MRLSRTHTRKNMKVRELLRERGGESENQLEKDRKDMKRLPMRESWTSRAEARKKGMYSLFQETRARMGLYQRYSLTFWPSAWCFPTVADCYTALGVIHAHWRPVPGKIKDYIAFPKPNGYQSIHDRLHRRRWRPRNAIAHGVPTPRSASTGSPVTSPTRKRRARPR